MRQGFLIWIFCMLSLACLAQSPKKHYKTAQKLVAGKQLSAAISELNIAIAADASFTDAISLRASVYELLGNYAYAANDYSLAAKQKPNTLSYLVKAGINYYYSGQYRYAITHLNDALLLDKNDAEIYQYKALTQNKLHEYDQAVASANVVINQNPNSLAYYSRAVANDSLLKFNQAISDYTHSIRHDTTFLDAYLGCILAYQKNNQLPEALQLANKTARKFESSVRVYQIRSLIYKQLNDLPNAINDLSKLETMLTDISEVLYTRGLYYFEFGLYQNAKSDFNRLLNLKQIPMAYYWRGRASEELLESDQALLDFKNFIRLAGTYNLKLVADANNRLFELKRETEQPVILIDTPMVTPDNKLFMAQQNDPMYITGRVMDASGIATLTINGQSTTVDQNGNFEFRVTPSQGLAIAFRAEDIYRNVLEVTYEIQMTREE